MNRRPRRPKRRALPSCATARCLEVTARPGVPRLGCEFACDGSLHTPRRTCRLPRVTPLFPWCEPSPTLGRLVPQMVEVHHVRREAPAAVLTGNRLQGEDQGSVALMAAPAALTDQFEVSPPVLLVRIPPSPRGVLTLSAVGLQPRLGRVSESVRRGGEDTFTAWAALGLLHHHDHLKPV